MAMLRPYEDSERIRIPNPFCFTFYVSRFTFQVEQLHAVQGDQQ